MKFFVDTAHLEDIKKAFDLGIVSGVTTNPVIIGNEGTHDIGMQIKKIRAICDGEILTQVVGRTADEMIAQAKIIRTWCDNITVKIPLNTEGIKAVSRLSKEGIRTCTTITYTPAQALAAAMAGASYVALFVNRSHASGYDGYKLIETVSDMYKKQNFETKILAASIDTPLDVVRAVQYGADCVTAGWPTWESLIVNAMTNATLDSFLDGWTGKEIHE